MMIMKLTFWQVLGISLFVLWFGKWSETGVRIPQPEEVNKTGENKNLHLPSYLIASYLLYCLLYNSNLLDNLLPIQILFAGQVDSLETVHGHGCAQPKVP